MQWLECLEIDDLTLLSLDSILPESVAILLVKLYGLLVVSRHLDPMFIFDFMPSGLCSKDLGHPDKLL